MKNLLLIPSTLKNFAKKRGNSDHKLAHRYHREEDGVAAIEFAIIAPVMIVMYFGLAEVASAISVDRRVSHSTNIAADLATQQPTIADDGIEEILAAALRTLDIRDIENVSIDIESFILPAESQPPESQGRITVNSGVGNFAPFDPTTLDENILNAQSGVVVTRLSYKYTPLQLRFFDSEITLSETFLLKPRRSDAVQIQDGKDSLVTCNAQTFADVSCSAG